MIYNGLYVSNHIDASRHQMFHVVTEALEREVAMLKSIQHVGFSMKVKSEFFPPLALLRTKFSTRPL